MYRYHPAKEDHAKAIVEFVDHVLAAITLLSFVFLVVAFL